MKMRGAVLLAYLCWGCALAGHADVSTMTSEERVARARVERFPHYADRLAHFLEDTPRREAGGIVFLGDSITEGFPLDAVFAEQNAINRGIGGDTIEGVIDRLDVSVRDLAPGRVHLLIGINDIVGKQNVTVEEFAGQYDRLLTALREAAPEAQIVVQTILPVRGRLDVHNPRVRDLNDHIRELASEHGTRLLDLYAHFRDSEDRLRSDYTMDDIHLTLEGYWTWLEAFAEPGELFRAAVSLAPRWTSGYGREVVLHAINPPEGGAFPGGRGVDQMIVYTPEFGRGSTGTNPWGLEAVVKEGRVFHVGGNNSSIPEDGFVVSGHGTAARWILVNLRPGVPIAIEGNTLRRGEPEEGEPTKEDRIRHLRYRYFTAVMQWDRQDRLAGFEDDATCLAASFQKLGQPGTDISGEDVAALEERLLQLENR